MSSSLSAIFFNIIGRLASFSGLLIDYDANNISLSAICSHFLSLSIHKVTFLNFSSITSTYFNFTSCSSDSTVSEARENIGYDAVPTTEEPIVSEGSEVEIDDIPIIELSDFPNDHSSLPEFLSKDSDDNWDDLTFDDTLYDKSMKDDNETYDVEPSTSISSFQLAQLPPGMPEIPPYFIERKEFTLQLLKRLRAATPQMFIVVSDSRASLRSGTGKSLLVAATISLEEVRRLYNGGIFWLHVGAASFDEVQMFNLIRKLARDISIRLTGTSIFLLLRLMRKITA